MNIHEEQQVISEKKSMSNWRSEFQHLQDLKMGCEENKVASQDSKPVYGFVSGSVGVILD